MPACEVSSPETHVARRSSASMGAPVVVSHYARFCMVCRWCWCVAPERCARGRGRARLPCAPGPRSTGSDAGAKRPDVVGRRRARGPATTSTDQPATGARGR
eukprot:1404004-Prymnesium_polylepis.1